MAALPVAENQSKTMRLFQGLLETTITCAVCVCATAVPTLLLPL